MSTEMLALEDVTKRFTLHLREGVELDVLTGVTFSVMPGECVALGGPSGVGKSSILKMIHGNYRTDGGRILVREGGVLWDVAQANPRRLLQLRRATVGYVSQFLRVIPRVSAFEIVAATARAAGLTRHEAEARARRLLSHLTLPERLWQLPPATFSGGEQQRVNIAAGFAASRPLLLLDEPTASLDARNREAVIELVEEKRRAGVAMLGIFHDDDVRTRIADRVIDVTAFARR